MDGAVIATVTATGVNAMYAVRHGHNIFPTLVGGGVLLVFVTGLNAVPGSNIGTAVAGTFLIGTLIYRGGDILSLLSGLLGG